MRTGCVPDAYRMRIVCVSDLVRIRYAPGTHYYASGTHPVRTRYVVLRIRYASGTHLVRIWYASGTHLVRIWYAFGTHPVRIWYASGTHPVRIRYASDTCDTHPVRIWYASYTGDTHPVRIRYAYGTRPVRIFPAVDQHCSSMGCQCWIKSITADSFKYRRLSAIVCCSLLLLEDACTCQA